MIDADAGELFFVFIAFGGGVGVVTVGCSVCFIAFHVSSSPQLRSEIRWLGVVRSVPVRRATIDRCRAVDVSVVLSRSVSRATRRRKSITVSRRGRARSV